MTTSRLPEITVTCRKDHAFRTRAHGGQGVDCPQCRSDGERVKVWIRKDRPRSARELADHEAIDSAGTAAPARPDAELAARWARESPWDGKARFAPGRDGDTCPKCSRPVLWEPGRTLIYCQPCKWGGLPPVVTEHYTRQAQRSAEVAVRDAPDLATERAARVRLRAMAQRMTDHVGEWIETFDPDELNGQAERLALDYQAELAAYLPEIRQAKSETELIEIAAEITAITGRAESSGAVATIERQREAIERQQQTAEQDTRWAEIARQAAEREQAERARESERQAAIAARTPKVIQGRAERSALGMARTNSNVQTAGIIAVAAHTRAEIIWRNGHCEFPHTLMKAAATEQVTGTMSYYREPHETHTGVFRCCYKHRADAIAYITSLKWPFYRVEDISKPGAPRHVEVQ